MLEDPGGNALALADEPEEQMLRPDVVVVEADGLILRELDHLLGPGAQRDLARGRLCLTAADDELHRRPDLRQLDAELVQRPRSEERRVGKECRSRWSP